MHLPQVFRVERCTLKISQVVLASMALPFLQSSSPTAFTSSKEKAISTPEPDTPSPFHHPSPDLVPVQLSCPRSIIKKFPADTESASNKLPRDNYNQILPGCK